MKYTSSDDITAIAMYVFSALHYHDLCNFEFEYPTYFTDKFEKFAHLMLSLMTYLWSCSFKRGSFYCTCTLQLRLNPFF